MGGLRCIHERRLRSMQGRGGWAGRSRARRRALLCALAVLACVAGLGAAAADAGTPYVDGISDQNLGLWNGDFQDPSGAFTMPFDEFFSSAWVGTSPSQHLRYARFVTAPDAVAQGGTCLSNLTTWFDYVTQTLHLIPVIAVWDVAEGGCADDGAPSTADYGTDVTALLDYLDSQYIGTGVPYLEAWNEPNGSGISAAQAAAYWTAANSVCESGQCTAIAGDFVDDDPDQAQPSFSAGCPQTLTYNTHLAPYESAYVEALGGAVPAIWGFHPYFAVNCEQDGSVTTFEQGLPASTPPTPPPEIWFTEVAAWECVRGQSTPRGNAAQTAGAEYLVDTLMASSAPLAPAHVFWYEMAAPNYTLDCSKYSDSELYEASSSGGYLTARPAAGVIFGTGPLAAQSGPASGVSGSQATLSGTVALAGADDTTYWFEYGPTTAYGSTTPPVTLGPGLGSQVVSATIAGLAPGVADHYSLVVSDPDESGFTPIAGPDMVTPLLSASPTTLTAGTPLTVSWSGISAPTAGDWIALYQPGAPAGSFLDWFYAGSCSQTATGAVPASSGSCSYTTRAAPGTYELRFYGSAAGDLLTTAGTITTLPPPPVDSAPPVVSGGVAAAAAYAGEKLTCSTGAWSSAPTAFSYQWTRNGAPLAGATSESYVVAASQLGGSLACAVTASNAGGAGTPAASAAVAVIPPPPSSGGSRPAISGSALEGARLVESHASWSNAPATFTYHWQRCNGAGGDCRPIAGATASTYTPSRRDLGRRLRVVETAGNEAGSASASSGATALVRTPPAPDTVLLGAKLGRTGASFRFRAVGVASGFACALVRVPARRGATPPSPRYARCSSPKVLSHLAAGRYVFYVRAIGPGGVDATPASRRFATGA